MRLWSIHPKHLDHKGLVALWRESLLAQRVLLGKTKGYKNHPQLIRFKSTSNPTATIGFYLSCIYQESLKRGYKFNKDKIVRIPKSINKIKVTRGQIEYEFNHLCKKVKSRNNKWCKECLNVKCIQVHPLFRVIKGKIEDWEKT